MSVFEIVAFSICLLCTVGVMVFCLPLANLIDPDHDPEQATKIMVRGFRAMGVWQVSVGLVLVSYGQATNTVALFGMGAVMWLAGEGKKRFPTGPFLPEPPPIVDETQPDLFD